jgi:hypothetical protein
VQGILKLLLAFLGGKEKRKKKLISRLKEACLRARHAAVKELLTDKFKIYRLAFAENNVVNRWDTVTFSDESIFSSANDGPVLV